MKSLAFNELNKASQMLRRIEGQDLQLSAVKGLVETIVEHSANAIAFIYVEDFSSPREGLLKAMEYMPQSMWEEVFKVILMLEELPENKELLLYIAREAVEIASSIVLHNI
ncbi:MAG: hypothetical protein DRJ51_06455 [Thermoprotei archaeon]|nr:MAG: hypothetical protein DRJ51_06455 [Thermoprotei archaeon]RLE80523.1 MAG: hypothetical protein DRJ36_02150 [Thermoprotei archaeon]